MPKSARTPEIVSGLGEVERAEAHVAGAVDLAGDVRAPVGVRPVITTSRPRGSVGLGDPETDAGRAPDDDDCSSGHVPNDKGAYSVSQHKARKTW